jgi:hypothetical protein
MFDELTTWWQNTTPQTQAYIRDGAVVLVALLGGQFLGALVGRSLRARKFDVALRLPGSPAPAPEAAHGFTPTFFATLLVRLTVWAWAGWWLARQHGQAELADRLALVLRRGWGLAALLVTTLSLGGLLAQRLIDCFQKSGPEAAPGRNGTASSPRGVAGAVGAMAYVLAALLVLLVAADSFDWPLTRSAVVALWQFAQHLFVAGATLLLGGLGARWARELATPDGASSPEKRAGQYTALGIVAATTVLATALVLSSAGVLIGLSALAFLGLLLWLVRGYLPDVVAGLQLRAHKVREIWSEGEVWQVTAIGFLTTEVSREGTFQPVRNRRVLEALLRGAPAEAAAR